MKKITLSLMMLASFGSLLAQQKVGINITLPTETLHVDSTIKIGKNTSISSSTPGRKNLLKFGDSEYVTIGEEQGDDKLYIRYGDLIFNQSTGSVGNGYIGIKTETPTATLDVNGTLRFRTGTPAIGKVLTSDANGNATWQAPSGTGIAFRGELGDNWAVTSAAGEFTVHGFTEEFDDGGGFNGSTGIFTAPSAGVYQFTINLSWSQTVSTTGSTIIIMRMKKTYTGGGYEYLEQTNDNLPNNTSYSSGQRLSTTCKLAAGESVSIEVDPQTATTFYISGNGSTAAKFSGSKLY